LKYFVVVQAWAYSLSEDECALESAFAEHLVTLRKLIGSRYEELVLVGPQMTRGYYLANMSNLSVLDVRGTGVRFMPAYDSGISRQSFLFTRFVPTWRWLKCLFSKDCVVQSGMSTQLAKPLMFMASLVARICGRPVVFMVDIDFRQHTKRFYRLGQWGLPSYLVNCLIYDPLKWIQLWIAPRLFDLCLYKSSTLVRDFGGGRANVRNFYDTAHSESDVLTADELALRRQWIVRKEIPLTAVFFGRLAANKGIDCMIRAVQMASMRGAHVRLRIIGDGPMRAALRDQINSEGLTEMVTMSPAVTYGAPLFSQLYDCHVSMAAPQVEDTPRATFDSMARGLPVVAFDITYFKDLAQESRAVSTSPWADASGLADELIRLANDRQSLDEMCVRAVDFASENTQTIWLRRRIEWLDELARH
jgi:glycosyltransferase involved in cell wall biosynthesis